MLNIVVSVIMASVTFWYFYAVCRYAYCLCAECHNALRSIFCIVMRCGILPNVVLTGAECHYGESHFYVLLCCVSFC
jgi:hypothetical protein